MDGWVKEAVDGAQALLGALGLKFINVVVGACSSFAGLNFWKGLETRKERWATFLSGWGIAAWGAEPLREYLELKAGVEVGLVILLGLFGMAVGAELVKLIRDTDWKGLVAGFFSRKTGAPPK